MMSKTLQKVADFIKLLLNTTKEQCKALIYTLTPLQTAAICEILFNIHKLPLTQRVLRELKKRRILFNKLVDKSVSVRRKLALIQNHYKQILPTLQLIRTQLLTLLE